MAVEGKLIEEYFQKLEWPFEKMDDHNWQSGYKGETFTFNFFVRTDENWLYVYAPFPVKIKAEARANMYEHLMRLNYRINMAKFMLDNDGDVGLTVEVPNENMQLSLFEDALRAVCFYMDDSYAELVNLATNAKAESSLKIHPASE